MRDENEMLDEMGGVELGSMDICSEGLILFDLRTRWVCIVVVVGMPDGVRWWPVHFLKPRTRRVL